MGILGKNFVQVSEKPCSQYFDLFNELIDLSALHGLVDELSANSPGMRATYEPETLLAQIIDKIIASQHSGKSEADSNQEES